MLVKGSKNIGGKRVSPNRKTPTSKASSKEVNTTCTSHEKICLNLKANDGLIDEMQLIEDIIKENIGEHEMGLKEWADFKHG